MIIPLEPGSLENRCLQDNGTHLLTLAISQLSQSVPIQDAHRLAVLLRKFSHTFPFTERSYAPTSAVTLAGKLRFAQPHSHVPPDMEVVPATRIEAITFGMPPENVWATARS